MLAARVTFSRSSSVSPPSNANAEVENFWFYFDLKAQSCSVTLCHDLLRPQTDRRLNTHRSHSTSVLNCDKDTVHVNFAAFRTNALSGHPPTFIEPSQVLHERLQAKTYTRWMGWLAVGHQDVESIDTAYASQKIFTQNMMSITRTPGFASA